MERGCSMKKLYLVVETEDLGWQVHCEVWHQDKKMSTKILLSSMSEYEALWALESFQAGMPLDQITDELYRRF